MHSDLSNAVTNIDSVTKFGEYIDRAKECGMRAMAFSEHGSVMEWYHKKEAIEAAGMKYIHAVECYLTESLDEKIRDNMHCVLIARNYDGVRELNRTISASFNRKDNHYYYVPRISLNELYEMSDNIIITSACVGGVFGKGSESVQKEFITFMSSNRGRAFLEIGHHPDSKQVSYNQKVYELSKLYRIPLIAGTDTHALNETHEKGRSILQRSKDISFDGEEGWDLKFKSYDELIESFDRQAALDRDVYMEAIENTNWMADMIEPFKLDTGTKYPHIYENSEAVFEKKVQDAIDSHPYALKNHSREEIEKTVAEEISVYKATKSIDFMLMQTYLREWERQNGIQCGYGRGSVSGSMVAYLLGITQMDSMKFDLNFFRFMNPSRVSNADIDSDYAGKDRDTVKQFLLRDKMGLPNIQSSEIITFNTIAIKGAVRDVCRALYKDRTDVSYLDLSKEISDNVDSEDGLEKMRKKYPDVFQYVDIVSGTIVSIGTHPSGVLISDLNIAEEVGLCSVSTSDYPVSMLNMKELDALMYVKLDILGLDNVGIINDTCEMLGIERMIPDNTDLNDAGVWRSIRDDTTLIFQWESNSAQAYLKKFMSDSTLNAAKSKTENFSMIKWFSFGNGLLRPSCASFRDDVSKGVFFDNGFDELNRFLAPEAGRVCMQETIMNFLVKFCGYSQVESDNVRRAISKKKGTEKLLPEIEHRFTEYSSTHYPISKEKCEEIIKPFIQIILDASAYSFSQNHSDAYSCLGYICGYLRYYHPLEFLTASLNIFDDNADKTIEISKYAKKVGIKITSPKWGISKSKYNFDRTTNTIAKGLSSIKYMSAQAADELYELAHSKTHVSFSDLLIDLKQTSLDSRQLDILIKLDFFSDFGNQRELFTILELAEMFKYGEAKQIKRDRIDGTPFEECVRRFSTSKTKSGAEAKSYTLLYVPAVMRECEAVVKNAGMQDISLLVKARNYIEIMGHSGFTTGVEADRNKLYVLDVAPVKRKKDGKVFGYGIITQSLGSGKESRMTVFKKIYDDDPISKGDIIVCKSWLREGQYFRMTGYEHMYA